MIFLFIAAAFIFGACVGSFLNVVILRLPKGNSLGGRSYCPHCHRTLVASDLFPIVSYILLRGRCRGCKKPISSRYALIEAVTGSLFALGFAVVYPQAIVDVIELARVWLVLSTLIVVFMIDLEHYLILNKVVIVSTAMLLFITILADIVARYYNPHAPLATVSGVLAAVASAGIFFLIWYFSKGRAMGLGDAKLLVFLGLALGWPNIWIMLFLSFFLGTLVSLPLLFAGKKQLSSKVPFGTFLTVASLVVLLWGDHLLRWYVSLAYILR